MQRTSDDQEDQRGVDEWVEVSELIARISAERGDPVDDSRRHRLVADADRRSRRRRIAPVIAGVATVLVATTVALTLRSGDTPNGPELNAALVGAANPSAVDAASASVTVPAPPAPVVTAP